ncbi:M48 family metallopeptidase [Desulfovibrio desulfuricans]|uniref:M48 family metallopeptidase n=1 Tax=Desulfovibrio desulfuricans TaxID=876 RepID=UPI0003B34B98|nr:SprT family zinc-dependent metalloprotease [Desulfovibrio desulfuricans]
MNEAVQTVHYGADSIHYVIRRHAGRHSRVRIHVHPDGLVEVEAPEEADSHAIREAVRARAQWIVGHLREIEKRRQHVLPRDYVSGESHFYLGRRYMLKVVVLDAAALRCKLSQGKQPAKTGVKLSGAYLTVTIRQPQLLRIHEDDRAHRRPVILTSCEDKAMQAARRQRVKILLRDWYREHAAAYFQKRLVALQQNISWLDSIPAFRLQSMQKQWGSCSPAGVLLLNQHLIKAPARCVDYVLLHEICHLLEHNHGKAFYALLESLLPDWQCVKDKLDNMAEILLNE